MGSGASLGGLIFWAAFCVVIVFFRGIHWDEHWDLAQVILGRVPYPEDHFLFIWTRHVRNIPIYLSTGIVWATRGPEWVNGFRNVAWMLATVLPAYLVAVALTRRALCGHVAALLTLWGLHITFDSSYPLYAWPSYFSNGQIGMGYGLVALALFLGGRLRSAALMLGFMPAIHIAHMPPLAMLAAAFGVWAWISGEKERAVLLRALPWLVPGFAASLALWLVPVDVAAPTSGAYAATGDWEPITRAYIAQGTHWSKPGVAGSFANSNFLLAAMTLLTLAAARKEWNAQRRPGPWTWLCVYVVLCACAVWGMIALHALLDDRVPFLIVAAMPYRLANHAAALALAVVPALLLGREATSAPAKGWGWCVMGAVLFFWSVKGIIRPLIGDETYTRFLGAGDGMVYALVGAAAAVLFTEMADSGRIRWMWAALWGIAVGLVGTEHQFGSACFLAGFLGSLAGAAAFERSGRAAFARSRTAGFIFGALCLLALAHIVVDQWQRRTPSLPIAEFDRAVTQVLDARGDAVAMVASHPRQHRLQSRIGRPVLVDSASADSMVYTRRLAPSLQKIHEDLYGIRFYPAPEADAPPWDEVWRRRSREDWRELAALYDFSYIISPNGVPLDLGPLLRGTDETLYALP